MTLYNLTSMRLSLVQKSVLLLIGASKFRDLIILTVYRIPAMKVVTYCFGLRFQPDSVILLML